MSDVDFSLINFQSTVVNNDKKRFFSTPGCVNANMKNRLVDVLGQYYCAFFSLPSTQIYFTILSFHSSFFISLAESYKLIHIHTPKKRRTVLRGERVRIKKNTNMHIFFYSGVSMTSSCFHFRFRLLLSFTLSRVVLFSVAATFF